MTLEVLIPDLATRQLKPTRLHLSDGHILQMEAMEDRAGLPVALPGFVDAHVHVESSMLLPTEFARLAVKHGTVATVSDPHEIANVCGTEGVHYMLANAARTPFHFCFGAPSCVPATAFETAGARLDAPAVEALLALPQIGYLSEVMNFPGVLAGDADLLAKIAAAKAAGKPVDGHAPGLRGEAVERYAAAGISTDHECFTQEEALDKLAAGMKILIREGSAARNFDALIGLLAHYEDAIMFCSDDKHPDSLLHGHINQLCARAAAQGIDPYSIIKAACVNPVLHYNLPCGLLRPGDPADFVLVTDLQSFAVEATYLRGELVARADESLLPSVAETTINQWGIGPIRLDDLALPASLYPSNHAGLRPVIECLDGQLITHKQWLPIAQEADHLVSDAGADVLKLVVVNRYHPAPVAKAFIKGIGLRQGALASSVAHDSHNIVAVGVDDAALLQAINLVVEARGGVSAVGAGEAHCLALPVAGLMSTAPAEEVAVAYTAIDAFVKETLGAQVKAPFMSLSFMALLVIPALKLSDKGLFDGEQFALMTTEQAEPLA